MYRFLFDSLGSGVIFGHNINIRHPKKIQIGAGTAIDDYCLLDAKDASQKGISIGSDVAIARETTIQCKGADISIGNNSTIGSQCRISSPGGVKIGKYVMIAGKSYIGGGRYRIDDLNKPIKEQQLYSKGVLQIQDDVWIGAGSIVQDGVTIGKGSVIGAGSIIQEDIPEYTIVVPHQRLVMLSRE